MHCDCVLHAGSAERLNANAFESAAMEKVFTQTNRNLLLDQNDNQTVWS
jgi:hypothetical protein